VNYVVTKVRMEQAKDHEHIEGVCTSDDVHYTRKQVVDSLDNRNVWTTRSPSGATATIRKITYCDSPLCMATPYITTRADNQKDDNLLSLPGC